MFSYFYIINICVIIVFICLFFITRKTNKRWSKINDYLGKVTTTVDSIRYGNLSTKIEKIEHPTYQNVTDSINRMVETLNDREKMIIGRRFFAGKTQMEVAEEIGISQAQVSRLEKSAINHIKKMYK